MTLKNLILGLLTTIVEIIFRKKSEKNDENK